jgi:hypothetical protein
VLPTIKAERERSNKYLPAPQAVGGKDTATKEAKLRGKFTGANCGSCMTAGFMSVL